MSEAFVNQPLPHGTSNLPDFNTEVLIIGAGPVGLALAADLARRGIQVKIVDKNTGPSTTSKALGVQAGTLEQLEYNFGAGLAEKLVATGNPTQKAFFHVDDRAPIEVNFSTIQGRFNYILVLEQSHTERILKGVLESLGGEVQWDTELLSFEQNENDITSIVKKPDGQLLKVVSRFVVGCDGAHSTVRRQLGMQFSGDTYSGTFLLGDVQLKWPWEYGSVRNFISAKGVMASFPMRGERKYRLILIRPWLEPDKPEITIDEFSTQVSELCAGSIEIQQFTWLTPFRVHHRIAPLFRVGRAFLSGDAAHIHSPVGGQGMNIGIQDSLNLSFKLWQVLRKNASSQVLENYEKERRPVALAVAKGTDRIFRLALLPEKWWVKFGRQKIFPWIIGRPFVQRKIAAAISEIADARREIGYRQSGE